MILPLIAALFLAQAGAASATDLETMQRGRLGQCLEEARSDPDAALVSAARWLAETTGRARAEPQQCLGFAYITQLRWDAAEKAFAAARSALPETAHVARARLAAMAGNAALAAENYPQALASLELAQADADTGGDTQLAGEIATDRARALVALERPEEAVQALAEARRDAPLGGAVWLLSATLYRRMDELDRAREFIEAAGALAPEDPAVALEAGVIAALSGQDDVARKNWHSVIAISPQSPEARDALFYLSQLDEAEPAE